MPPRLPDVGSALEGGANGTGGMVGISAVSNGGAVVEEASTVQPIALRQGRGTRLSFLGGANTSRKRDSIQLPNGDGAILESRKSSVSRGEGDSVSEHSRSRSKENTNRRSFFRANGDKAPPLPQFGGPETTIVGGTTSNGNGSTQRLTKSGGGSSGSNNYTTSNTTASTTKPRSNGASDWVKDMGTRQSSDLGSMDRKKSASSMMSGGNGNSNSNGIGELDAGGVAKMGSVRKRLSMLKLGKKSSKANGLMVAVDEE